jgi:hypothetical protein
LNAARATRQWESKRSTAEALLESYKSSINSPTTMQLVDSDVVNAAEKPMKLKKKMKRRTKIAAVTVDSSPLKDKDVDEEIEKEKERVKEVVVINNNIVLENNILDMDCQYQETPTSALTMVIADVPTFEVTAITETNHPNNGQESIIDQIDDAFSSSPSAVAGFVVPQATVDDKVGQTSVTDHILPPFSNEQHGNSLAAIITAWNVQDDATKSIISDTSSFHDEFELIWSSLMDVKGDNDDVKNVISTIEGDANFIPIEEDHIVDDTHIEEDHIITTQSELSLLNDKIPSLATVPDTSIMNSVAVDDSSYNLVKDAANQDESIDRIVIPSSMDALVHEPSSMDALVHVPSSMEVLVHVKSSNQILREKIDSLKRKPSMRKGQSNNSMLNVNDVVIGLLSNRTEESSLNRSEETSSEPVTSRSSPHRYAQLGNNISNDKAPSIFSEMVLQQHILVSEVIVVDDSDVYPTVDRSEAPVTVVESGEVATPISLVRSTAHPMLNESSIAPVSVINETEVELKAVEFDTPLSFGGSEDIVFEHLLTDEMRISNDDALYIEEFDLVTSDSLDYNDSSFLKSEDFDISIDKSVDQKPSHQLADEQKDMPFSTVIAQPLDKAYKEDLNEFFTAPEGTVMDESKVPSGIVDESQIPPTVVVVIESKIHLTPSAEHEYNGPELIVSSIVELESEVPTDPVLEYDSDISPIVIDKSEVAPLAEDESDVLPMVQDQSVGAPIVINESEVTHIAENESEVTLIVEDESKEVPMAQDESEVLPMAQDQFEGAPMVINETEVAHIAENEFEVTPIVQDESEVPSIAEDESEEVPMAQDESDVLPMVQDQSEGAPIVINETEVAHIAENESEVTPIVQDESEEVPIVVDDSAGAPIDVDESEDVPTAGDESEVTLTVKDDSKGAPLTVDDSEVAQVLVDELEGAPTVIDDSEVYPTAENEFEEVAIAENDSEVPPIAEDESEEVPIVVDEFQVVPIPENGSEVAPLVGNESIVVVDTQKKKIQDSASRRVVVPLLQLPSVVNESKGPPRIDQSYSSDLHIESRDSFITGTGTNSVDYDHWKSRDDSFYEDSQSIVYSEEDSSQYSSNLKLDSMVLLSQALLDEVSYDIVNSAIASVPATTSPYALTMSFPVNFFVPILTYADQMLAITKEQQISNTQYATYMLDISSCDDLVVSIYNDLSEMDFEDMLVPENLVFQSGLDENFLLHLSNSVGWGSFSETDANMSSCYLRGSMIRIDDALKLVLRLWHNFISWKVQTVLMHAALIEVVESALSQMHGVVPNTTTDDANRGRSWEEEMLALLDSGRKLHKKFIDEIIVKDDLKSMLERWELDPRRSVYYDRSASLGIEVAEDIVLVEFRSLSMELYEKLCEQSIDLPADENNEFKLSKYVLHDLMDYIRSKAVDIIIRFYENLEIISCYNSTIEDYLKSSIDMIFQFELQVYRNHDWNTYYEKRGRLLTLLESSTYEGDIMKATKDAFDDFIYNDDDIDIDVDDDNGDRKHASAINFISSIKNELGTLSKIAVTLPAIEGEDESDVIAVTENKSEEPPTVKSEFEMLRSDFDFGTIDIVQNKGYMDLAFGDDRDDDDESYQYSKGWSQSQGSFPGSMHSNLGSSPSLLDPTSPP